MIAPEIWSFPAPPCAFQFENGDLQQSESALEMCVSTHYLNHHISVVLPDTVMIPSSILDSLSQDCDYYQLEQVPVSEFIQQDFIDSFIKKGNTSMLSINTKLDTDDCACLTPDGHLVLSLNKVVYEELGLEGCPSPFCRQKPPTRYTVSIDLTANHFKPGKKNYERVKWCLTDRLGLKFDFLMAWDPPDADTCPSSIAAYINSRGYQVEVCQPRLSQRRDIGVSVPSIDDCDSEELLEWIGAYCTQADLVNGAPSNSVSTYEPPVSSPASHFNVTYLQWSGFFTTSQIRNLLQLLKNFAVNKHNIPWVCLHVQGFDDSPVSWSLQENCFLQSGDNAYTLFLQPNLHYLLCQTLGARRKLLSRSRNTSK